MIVAQLAQCIPLSCKVLVLSAILLGYDYLSVIHTHAAAERELADRFRLEFDGHLLTKREGSAGMEVWNNHFLQTRRRVCSQKG